ncbi:MAG: ArdC family protein, partial [Deltaproteobacteria bacterium]|nr:ArdC family protein [Deltaproteobacteria bacterium]
MTDTYEKITEKIVASLEKGVIPWKKPWRGVSGIAPSNLISGKAYQGINALILGLGCSYENPYWLTYKQAKSLGGWVKRGEKSVEIVFWTWLEREFESKDGD